jgi:hypothetical protein
MLLSLARVKLVVCLCFTYSTPPLILLVQQDWPESKALAQIYRYLNVQYLHHYFALSGVNIGYAPKSCS